MQKRGGGGREKGGGGGGGKATLWQAAKRATQIIAYAQHRRAKAALTLCGAAARCPGAAAETGPGPRAVGGGGGKRRLDSPLTFPL